MPRKAITEDELARLRANLRTTREVLWEHSLKALAFKLGMEASTLSRLTSHKPYPRGVAIVAVRQMAKGVNLRGDAKVMLAEPRKFRSLLLAANPQLAPEGPSRLYVDSPAIHIGRARWEATYEQAVGTYLVYDEDHKDDQKIQVLFLTVQGVDANHGINVRLTTRRGAGAGAKEVQYEGVLLPMGRAWYILCEITGSAGHLIMMAMPEPDPQTEYWWAQYLGVFPRRAPLHPTAGELLVVPVRSGDHNAAVAQLGDQKISEIDGDVRDLIGRRRRERQRDSSRQ